MSSISLDYPRKNEDDIKVVKLPEKKSRCHVVFSKDLESVAVRYNEAFDQIDGERTFMQIMSKYVNISKLQGKKTWVSAKK